MPPSDPPIPGRARSTVFKCALVTMHGILVENKHERHPGNKHEQKS